MIPHIPVLLDEVLEIFKDIKDGYIVDCTLGYGGHTEAILIQNPDIKMVCIDQDIEAIEFSKKRLEKFTDRVEFIHMNFSEAFKHINGYNIKGILADIGVSSLQLDNSNRGFGFDSDCLDMRMDNRCEIDAYYIVNSYSKVDLERIFLEYGEERLYKKIASIICDYRKTKKIESAKELSSLISRHIYSRDIHPATRIFQAIRIEVNRELDVLEELINIVQMLNKNLRFAVISFHSLEDRIVKDNFKEFARDCICDTNSYKCECGNNNSFGKIVTKKPIVASSSEIKKNRRARSAKMRVFDFEGAKNGSSRGTIRRDR